jgi:hypothetical protein
LARTLEEKENKAKAANAAAQVAAKSAKTELEKKTEEMPADLKTEKSQDVSDGEIPVKSVAKKARKAKQEGQTAKSDSKPKTALEKDKSQ